MDHIEETAIAYVRTQVELMRAYGSGNDITEEQILTTAKKMALQVRHLKGREPFGYACPKCSYDSGDAWEQCRGNCAIPHSPHYNPKWATELPDAMVEVLCESYSDDDGVILDGHGDYVCAFDVGVLAREIRRRRFFDGDATTNRLTNE